jgi:hypothetical protein
MLIDFDSNLQQLKNYQQHVVLWPERWHSFTPTIPLAWRKVKFSEANTSTIPTAKGIYAFVVQFHDDAVLPIHLPSHGYVMYVGITPDRTLRERYRDYLRDKRRPKRWSVYSMLNKWSDDCFFYYSAVTDPGVDLRALEIALNDAIIPPYVTMDFSAEVRKLVRVLRAN